MTEDEINKYREWKREHPDFPLTVQPVGQWSNKVHGKVHYFGPLDNPDAALRLWLQEKDYLLAGMQPPNPRERIPAVGQSSEFETLERIAERLGTLCEKAETVLLRFGRVASDPMTYTIEEVAEKLCISKRAAVALLKRGRLAYIEIPTSPSGKRPQKRIRHDDLIAFLDARRVAPPIPQSVRMRRRRAIRESFSRK